MLIQCAKVIGLTADHGLKNVNVLGIANGRGQRLVNFHDLRGSGKEGNELGDSASVIPNRLRRRG
jgi:hypothetical protein